MHSPFAARADGWKRGGTARADDVASATLTTRKISSPEFRIDLPPIVRWDISMEEGGRGSTDSGSVTRSNG